MSTQAKLDFLKTWFKHIKTTRKKHCVFFDLATIKKTCGKKSLKKHVKKTSWKKKHEKNIKFFEILIQNSDPKPSVGMFFPCFLCDYFLDLFLNVFLKFSDDFSMFFPCFFLHVFFGRKKHGKITCFKHRRNTTKKSTQFGLLGILAN